MLTTSKSSHRLCLLLKTLLILLCIYIKRVTAAPVEPSSVGECLIPNHNVQQIIAFENEMSVEIDCPLKDAIKLKEETEKLKKSITNPAKQRLFKMELDDIRRGIRNSTRVSWQREGKPLYRENGNPVLEQLITNKSEAVLTLLTVGQSDAGAYSCVLNYTNPPKDSCKYFNLSPSFHFDLQIRLSSDVPDVKPTISHPPADKLVRRGDDVTFECKKKDTLSHQTTYWFASRCSPGDHPECADKFKDDFNKYRASGVGTYINKYIFGDPDLDELKLFNVTETDIGYYGCLVSNNKGFDIRFGHLNLFEAELLKKPIIPTYNGAETTQAKSNDDNITTERPQLHDNSITEATAKHLRNLTVAHSRERLPNETFSIFILCTILALVLFLFLIVVSRIISLQLNLGTISKNKKNDLHPPSPVVGIRNSDERLRQHLPVGECPDIYNIGKHSDGFISGLLAHNNGHSLSESVCSRLLHKEKDPSISSNSNSDEASSWGQPTSSHGDNCRAFYHHTSNTTTTTVPLYDHPPSWSAGRLRGTVVQDACIINPTYGLLRTHDSDEVDWSFPRRNLERLNKIGEGQFGEVWRYIARKKDGSASLVAVKQLKNRVGISQRERIELADEIEIMKLVNDHPNVIKLLNFCYDEFEPLLLIMEYAEEGKLQDYLRKCRKYKRSYASLVDFQSVITSKELVKFSYHIAKGMEYVASKGIIHRDLASRNILVSKDMVCKVADFGFARRVDDDCAYERSTTNIVPVKWMAPEALVENKFTSKSDVYSFGILMWEIVTLGATPYESMTSDEVMKKVPSGHRLERPHHCKEEFYQIMASCWLENPAQRPNFKELAQRLEKLLISENDYIELDQYPEHAYYNILSTDEKDVVRLSDTFKS